MEIYRNSEPVVEIDVPLTGATYTVYVVNSDGTKTPVPNASNLSANAESSRISVTIPFNYTQVDGTINLEILMQRQDGGGGNATFEEYVDVVTPLFTWHDLGNEYPKNDVPELERLIRHVIEAHTGQYFGKRREKVFASSHDQIVRFERPLIMLTDMSWEGRYAPLSTTLSPPKIPYETIDDGFSIVMNWDGYDVKTDSLWVIRNKCPRIVTLEGFFGYNRVPADIKEAAILIAGVWGCKQGVWRDRFIQIMRSADWSIQYNERVFASTGSATADQLLSKYRRTHLPEVF